MGRKIKNAETTGKCTQVLAQQKIVLHSFWKTYLFPSRNNVSLIIGCFQRGNVQSILKQKSSSISLQIFIFYSHCQNIFNIVSDIAKICPILCLILPISCTIVCFLLFALRAAKVYAANHVNNSHAKHMQAVIPLGECTN